MRIARVQLGAEVFFASVDAKGESAVRLAPDPFTQLTTTSEQFRLQDATLLPVTAASKVIAVGLNYRSHAEEMGKPLPAEPMLFLKAPSCLNGHRQPIVLPPESREVHHEGELAVVIGRRMRRANEQEARDGIFGLTCFNDVTARDLQRKDVQYSRAKSFDTFGCVGPWMVPLSALSADDLRLQCRVDGQRRQDGRTSDMIFPPARLVSFISQVMTLFPGDIVTTGTPSGVGLLTAGATVDVEIEGIGVLSNPVQRAQ